MTSWSSVFSWQNYNNLIPSSQDAKDLERILTLIENNTIWSLNRNGAKISETFGEHFTQRHANDLISYTPLECRKLVIALAHEIKRNNYTGDYF